MKRVIMLQVLLLIVINSSFSQGTKFDFSLINPHITSTNLLAAWFFDAATGYIAGGAGAVLFTNDSGRTWRECDTPKRIWISSLYFNDIQDGWAAGGANYQLYLISTTDGGQTWREHAIPELDGKIISKINFRNSMDGWISGGSAENGFVYRTTDGGSTWLDRSPKDLQVPYHVIEDIIFPDSNTVVICGYRGYVARSIDNGVNWQRIEWKSIAPDSLIFGPLEQFQKVGGSTIFCKGKEDILRSDDGGVTWKDVFFIGMHGGMQLGGFYFHSADAGFAIGGYGAGAMRFMTTDGGGTWSATNDTVGEVTGSILFPGNGDQGYIIGRRAEVYRITPMGENKVQLNTGYNLSSVPTVDFYDGNNGCIGGVKPIGLRTTADGGKTWRVVDSSTDYTGAIRNGTDHVALRNGMVSTDGGVTWQQALDGLGGERTLYRTVKNDAVYFTQINQGGLGSRLFVTKDWFATSTECQFPPAAGNFFFLSADTGWSASQQTLYLTCDGARTWTEVGAMDGVIGANCILFIDNIHGWVGGVSPANGKPTTILRTSDGGATWTPQEEMTYLPDSLYPPLTPRKGRLPTQICAKNLDEAWFIDGFFCIFYTNDGGKKWQQVGLPPKCGDAYVEGNIALAGDGTLFCTGTNGMLLQINTTSGDGVTSRLRNTCRSKKRSGTLLLPFSPQGKQTSPLYELNGVRITPENKGRNKRICKPVVVK
ncbi:MAG: hypothetical protein JW863_11620 [Chitinispirillaceae bacterium]|nr:hypothetical protein [Chitinispirillaceae bacterium]